MTGFVGIVCAETARYSQFHADLHQLIAPEGIDIITSIGASDSALSMSRNEIVRAFLKTDADWLLMIDDDHAIDPRFLVDLIRRQVGRPPVPILSSLYLTKKAPFQPTLYGKPYVEGGRTWFPGLFLDEFPTTGIVPVYATGASGQLVRRVVYETLPAPWYNLGQSDHLGEDMLFCHVAQQAGFPVHVDLEARLGHLAPFQIWPHVLNGQWITSIRRDTFAVAIDPPKSLIEPTLNVSDEPRRVHA